MRKITTSACVCVAMAVASSAFGASSCVEVKSSIAKVRDSLLQMLKNPEKRGADQQAIVKQSAEKVTELIEKLEVNPANKAVFTDMNDTWKLFIKVRDEEVVPMILAGKNADAEKLASGVQKERLKKVMDLCDKVK